MAKRLKVYSGCFDGQTEVMVAATSQAAARAAFGVSAYAFSQFGGMGGSDQDDAIALAEPGVIFSQPYSSGQKKGWVRGSHRYSRNKPWPPEGHQIVQPKEG